jgi:hypothetical protein
VIDLRLRAYAPNGAALGLLPEASELGAGLPFDDVSSLTVTYSRLAAGGTVLDRDLGAGLELALEYTTGGAWVEPRNGRFLYLKREFDVVDETDTVKATCPGYAWQLRKARLEHKAGVEPVDGKRPFLSATVGAILVTLLTESQARGEVTGFTTTATSTHDSAGAPWSQVITIYYEPGLDLWSVLDSLTQQGMCDWAMQGRELQLYNVDTALVVDRTTGADPTSLRLGRDVTNAPSDESIEELISRAVLRGDNGLVLVEDNPTAPTPWGVWTGTISQGGVSDEGTMRALVQADLARGARVRGQYTRELITTGPTPPLTAYGPGDYVKAAGATRELERLRVRQVTLSKGSNGVTGSVVLNDRVLEAELRRSRRISGIVGGASSDGGSGARPSTPGPDRRTPQTPAGLVADSDAYIDGNGMPRAAVTASWAPVTHATDGTVLEGVSYILWGRPAVSGGVWRSLLTADATTVSTSPFDVGSSWQFRVQAVSQGGVASGFSDAVTVAMEDDTTPPPPPSAPILTSKLGTVTVTWDGLTETGTAMPHDFERVEVRIGVPGTPGPVIGTLRTTSGSEFLVATGMPPDDPVTFEFQAIDRSGNASAWSEISTITPVRIAGPDLEANSVTTNELVAGSVTGVILHGDAVNGKTITGALIRTAASGTRTEMSASGVRTFDASGNVVARLGGNANGALQVFHDTGQSAIYVGPLTGGAKGVRVAEPDGTTLFNAWADAAGAGQFLALADAVQLTARTDHLKLSSQMTNGYVQINSGLQYFAAPSSTFAANTGISSSPFNVFYKLTSSRRSKVAIEDLDTDLARRLFDVPVRTWFDRTQVEAHAAALEATASGVLSPETVELAQTAAEWGAPLRRVPGVVAEEVEAAGLEGFVTYEPDPDSPDRQRTSGVMYDRMWTLLIPLVREQDERIRDLTETVDEQARQLEALAARLDALEAAATTRTEIRE